jgi:ASC-1-like (ASCH) protein
MEEENEIQIWEMEISPPWVYYIYSGEKKKEVRKNSKTWGKVKVGDLIDIYEKGKLGFMRFKVIGVAKYGTIEECLTKEGVSNLLPGIKTFDEGLEVYLSLDGEANIEKRKKEYDSEGVIAIEVEKI